MEHMTFFSVVMVMDLTDEKKRKSGICIHPSSTIGRSNSLRVDDNGASTTATVVDDGGGGDEHHCLSSTISGPYSFYTGDESLSAYIKEDDRGHCYLQGYGYSVWDADCH